LLPLGEGLARLIARSLPDVEATAETTPSFVDAALRIGEKRADLAFLGSTIAYQAARGEGAFQGRRVPLRTLAHLFYPYRREYVEWITEARRPETRTRRIAQAVARISAGRSEPT